MESVGVGKHEVIYLLTNRKDSSRCACVLDKVGELMSAGDYRGKCPPLQKYKTRKIYGGWANAPEGLH